MKILAIDAVTEACSVALSIEGVSAVSVKIEANQHSAFILDMIDQLLAEHQLSLAQLDLIAVDNGPGSFTGIRIGIGVAQGLAYGANLPVLGVNSLAVLAAQSDSDGSVLAMIDARMQQVYWAQYLAHPLAYDFDQLMKVPLYLDAPNAMRLAGNRGGFELVANGWQQVQTGLDSSLRPVQLNTEVYPMAEEVAAIASLASNKMYQTAAELIPIYLRNNVASVSTKKKL